MHNQPFWTGQLRKHPNSEKLSRDVSLDYLVDLREISQAEAEEKFRNLRKKEHDKLHFIPESQMVKYAEENWEQFNLRGRCSLTYLLPKLV